MTDLRFLDPTGLVNRAAFNERFLKLNELYQYWWRKRQNGGAWSYLHSSDRAAYPDSGIVDGYEYEYLGVPFDNAVVAPKIATGSYVGTGTHGTSNPNTLIFDFSPKIIFVGENRNLTTSAVYNFAVVSLNDGDSLEYYPTNGGSTYRGTITVSGKSVSWKNTNDANHQLNTKDRIFYYTAIGY